MRLVILLLALAAALNAQTEAPVWAEVRSDVKARGLRLKLGDIAKVGGVERTAVARANDLDLGPMPAPGQSQLISRATLETLIKRASGHRGGPTLTGATAVRIEAESLVLEASHVRTMARRWLIDQLGPKVSEAEIEASGRSLPLTAPVGRFSTRFDVVRVHPKRPLAGLVALEVVAIVDGKKARAAAANFVVRRPQHVVIVTRNVSPGRPIPPEALALEKRMSDGAFVDPLFRTSDAVGRLARGRLRRGQVLTKASLREAPVVHRNSQVIVRAVAGALTVTGEGRSLEDGAPGETIRVQVGARRRIVRAVVVDSRTVEIREGGL